MLIDSHAHVNFAQFKEDYGAVIDRALQQGIGLLNVGSQYSTSQRAVELAAQYPRQPVYAAIGLHPIHLVEQTYSDVIDGEKINFQTRAETFDYQKYKQLAAAEKVVAIGETGFDFFHCDRTAVFKKQQDSLDQQIKLAQELDKPVIFHCRDGYEELLAFLKNYSDLKGVIHCFGGDLKQAENFLALGLFIGFTGIVTFKNALPVQQAAREIPLERLLVETDCPYLAPDPYRGQRNEPSYVRLVVEKIAQLKGLPLAEVAEQTTANAKQLFRL